ncbi:hypothetical protein [Microcoleus sp. Pol12A6]|uniref:hypothetical protein n=1 Tax=Microcoleus sp. Pol12A6 TaxID=3055393 RepID=UPI002FD05E20
MLEEIGVLLGEIRNYARSNFIKLSSRTWRTMENKVFGAKQAQAFRLRSSIAFFIKMEYAETLCGQAFEVELCTSSTQEPLYKSADFSRAKL